MPLCTGEGSEVVRGGGKGVREGGCEGEKQRKEKTPVGEEEEEEEEEGEEGERARSPSDNVSSLCISINLYWCQYRYSDIMFSKVPTIHISLFSSKHPYNIVLSTCCQLNAFLTINSFFSLQQILQMTIVKNLDTGDSFPLSVVDEKIPLRNPLNQHLYRRTAAAMYVTTRTDVRGTRILSREKTLAKPSMRISGTVHKNLQPCFSTKLAKVYFCLLW